MKHMINKTKFAMAKMKLTVANFKCLDFCMNQDLESLDFCTNQDLDA